MVRPTDLRCEYQPHPIAIDTASPRFSWINDSEDRDVKQSAYQIIVRSNDLPLWDTGKVASSEHHLLPYDGPALVSNTTYEWTVQVWDDDGNESGPSAPGHFEMIVASSGGAARSLNHTTAPRPITAISTAPTPMRVQKIPPMKP